MGVSFAKMWQQIFANKEMKLVMVGLDGAGKTTILYKFKLDETITTIPTIGFNVETVECNNVSFTVWDIGGQDKIRRLWGHYYEGCDGIVFVVDSNDRERIEDAREELERMLDTPQLESATLLVFANKQDLPNSMSPSDIAHKLGLANLRNRRWNLQRACAPSGEGLIEGFQWLAKNVGK